MQNSEFEADTRSSPKVLDLRIPLTWIVTGFILSITGVATLVWNISIQNSKLEQLVSQFAKLDIRLDQSATADQLFSREVYDLKIKLLQHEYQLQTLMANSDRYPSSNGKAK